jgi:hypothetical protein
LSASSRAIRSFMFCNPAEKWVRSLGGSHDNASFKVARENPRL